MNEQKTIERLMRATRGLAYWSGELLKVNAAIERHVNARHKDIQRRNTARKDHRNAS